MHKVVVQVHYQARLLSALAHRRNGRCFSVEAAFWHHVANAAKPVQPRQPDPVVRLKHYDASCGLYVRRA